MYFWVRIMTIRSEEWDGCSCIRELSEIKMHAQDRTLDLRCDEKNKIFYDGHKIILIATSLKAAIAVNITKFYLLVS